MSQVSLGGEEQVVLQRAPEGPERAEHAVGDVAHPFRGVTSHGLPVRPVVGRAPEDDFLHEPATLDEEPARAEDGERLARPALGFRKLLAAPHAIREPPRRRRRRARLDREPRAVGQPYRGALERTVSGPGELAHRVAVTIEGLHERNDTIKWSMLIWRSALEIGDLIRAKKLSPVEIADAVRARIDANH